MQKISILILVLFLFSCENTPDTSNSGSGSAFPPIDTTPIPAAPPISTSNPVPIDAAWINYWKRFNQAVENDGRALMFGLTNFPLPGANNLSSQIYAEKADQDDFRDGYFEIFDDLTKRAVAQTKATEVEYYTLVGDEYKGSIAQEVGLDEGSKIYKFRVGIFTKTSSGEGAMGFDNYHFGKFGSSYKLAWITTERPE